ncbi:glycerophosphoryl diester phosphodiesterase [Longitalea luteola]|uniref:glycerophosphoryl diester phosphodiesterase n=1 Tax=Longitalea luteola TaxID=2812563 RepID=UPI001A973A65|nr:glycerophosphoryl diester phosphodiesterase [Longitalea luteola]
MRTHKKHSITAWVFIIGCALLMPCSMQAQAAASNTIQLRSGRLQLSWHKQAGGWQLKQLSVRRNNEWIPVAGTSGEYTVLYAAQKPDTTPLTIYNEQRQPPVFPEPQYRYIIPVWKEAVQPVAMNTAGEAIAFYPAQVTAADSIVQFTQEEKQAVIKAVWQMDARYETDILVQITLTAKQDGYYSIASPSLAIVPNGELSWGMVPGHFQGNAIQNDFIKAYAYGQGIPAKPVVTHDRTAATLSPLVSNKKGITIAVIPAPGTSRDPWAKDNKTQADWHLGLSVMDRRARLTPVAWHPVLGQKGSFLQKGDSVQFNFRYCVQAADWYTVYKHAVNDIYHLKDFLALKQTSQSLTDRILAMQQYVVDDSTSKWKVEQYRGLAIGAQQYLGGVYGAQKDAVKNADYGAMWMLANITHDSILKQTRLPYVRNFKLAQQDTTAGFFHGAAAGQYYLTQSKKFTEEWGPYVEPIGTTYYMLMDIGNVLLFNPHDSALKKELQLAADKLLAWMNANGQWAVAYDHETQKPLFTDIEDLRPTFYGLVIAYKLLHDKKYLTAARKGADWYITHAVNKGHFTGVCGDTRFAPDFATGQSAQALLDLYEITKEKKYLQAAVHTAKLYTTSVYTHPIPTREVKLVKGKVRHDWEISQVGLSFEHGGSMGSANHRGPILLASHAGLFIRMYSLTQDSLFLTMARAAALGRDAFVDPKTSVASYYWDVMDNGAGPYPHHAWWQIGWITDYLLSEVSLRTAGKVSFPRGFITPKVGPHQTYAFAAGTVFGNTANLYLQRGLLTASSAYLDHFAAINSDRKKLWLLLLNNDDEPLQTSLTIDYSKVINNKTITAKKVVSKDTTGKPQVLNVGNNWQVHIPAYGVRVIEIDYE